MSGRSLSAKNLVVAVIATIALPLFVPTGTIGFAPTKETQTLSPAEIEAETLAAKDEPTYLSHPDVNMPKYGVFEAIGWEMEDRELWRSNRTASHPKEGNIMPYCPDVKHPYRANETHLQRREIGQRLAKEIGMDKVPTKRTGLLAIYTPYMVDRSKNDERRNLDFDTVCATFLTPFHFFVIVPHKLDDEFTALFNNETLPTKVCHPRHGMSRNIYAFTHPSTDILPNYSEALDVGPEATAFDYLPKGKCRDFVVTQFQGLRKIMDVFQGYLECKGEDGRVQRAEEVNIFIHWLLYFAEEFPAVFEEPTQHERPHEIMDFPPAESDKGFFLPAFEAMLEGIAEATELRFKNFEREHDANP